jgi:hypothetical protein
MIGAYCENQMKVSYAMTLLLYCPVTKRERWWCTLLPQLHSLY